MELTEANYYTKEADQEFMSYSQYKDFCGCPARPGCEFRAMQRLRGEYEQPESKALLVGSYVDSYFDGSLEDFKDSHPQIFTRAGDLKAEFRQAETMIDRVKRDKYFMDAMSGEKQKIMTGLLFGAPWKIKMDSYIPGTAIVDLKTVDSITDLKWSSKEHRKMDFIRYSGYDIQGAVYQAIVKQVTGETLPFYIAAVSKEPEPDIWVIHVGDEFLDEALLDIQSNMPRILDLKAGKVEPVRCEKCDACRKTRKLEGFIELMDLIPDDERVFREDNMT